MIPGLGNYLTPSPVTPPGTEPATALRLYDGLDGSFKLELVRCLLNPAYDRADLVVCVGTRLIDLTTGSHSLFQHPQVRFIGINVNAADANKLGATPIVADAREALVALHERLQGWTTSPEMARSVRGALTAWRSDLAADIAIRAGDRMGQGEVLQTINNHVRAGDWVVAAAGKVRDPRGLPLNPEAGAPFANSDSAPLASQETCTSAAVLVKTAGLTEKDRIAGKSTAWTASDSIRDDDPVASQASRTKVVTRSERIASTVPVLVAVSATAVVGSFELGRSAASLALVARTALGPRADRLLAIIALCATANTVLLLVVSASRSIYGMAAAGLLPTRLATVSERRQVPGAATAIAVAATAALVLLGDAAHSMLPHLGQGANQSIEDGMALAAILTQVDTAAVPAALLAYEKLRRERVAEVQFGARTQGLRVDSACDDLDIRDAELAAHAEFRKHLYTYDVVPHARAAAAALHR